MSPKELMYIEDALGHETHMQNCCRATQDQFQSPDLSRFAADLAERHRLNFARVMELLQNGGAN